MQNYPELYPAKEDEGEEENGAGNINQNQSDATELVTEAKATLQEDQSTAKSS